MRATKLIFVDGLPGTGKTTAATWLAARLQDTQLQADLYLEFQQGHPTNVGGDLHPAGDVSGDAFFAVYTPEAFVEQSLQRWEAFVGAARESQAISVFDSCPYQNGARILLQMDASIGCIRAYAGQLEALVGPLQPLLVYFSHRDVETALQQFRAICDRRGQAWTEYVIALVSHSPYGVSRHLQGFDGVMQFVRDYKLMSDMLVAESRLPRILLENCEQRWDGCYRQIEELLQRTAT
jgi:hypothetical protein